MVPPRPDIRIEPVPWNVGEHVSVIGTTGTGKTFLLSRLVQRRKYVAVLRTKPDDIEFPGFTKVTDSKPLEKLKNTRYLVVPEFRKQRTVAAGLFDLIWTMGGWTVVIDELFYVHDMLKLKEWADMLLTQGRSKKISVVTGMQRPVNVTRFALSESTHIFAFHLEGRDRKTVRDITSEDFASSTGRIRRYHFAHYHVPSRSVGVGTADRLDETLVPMR